MNLPDTSRAALRQARCAASGPRARSLGEGLLWSVREQALYWVDILGAAPVSLRPGERQARTNGASTRRSRRVAERANAPGLIVTLRRGFAFFDPAAADAEPH